MSAPYGSCAYCAFVYPEPGENGGFCSGVCWSAAIEAMLEEPQPLPKVQSFPLPEVPAGRRCWCFAEATFSHWSSAYPKEHLGDYCAAHRPTRTACASDGQSHVLRIS